MSVKGLICEGMKECGVSEWWQVHVKTEAKESGWNFLFSSSSIEDGKSWRRHKCQKSTDSLFLICLIKHLYFILEHSWFTMLCQFRVYSKVIQLYIYLLFFRFSEKHILNRVSTDELWKLRELPRSYREFCLPVGSCILGEELE